MRKIAQTIGFLGPAACLMLASFTEDPLISSFYVIGALGLTSFSTAGLYCNHQDLSPQYSSFLLGLTNTAAAFQGIFGIWLTGLLLDQTGSWAISLFSPSILFFILGSAVFIRYGEGEVQDFSDDHKFAIEEKLNQKKNEILNRFNFLKLKS